eukprot:gene12057-8309_t
MITAPKRTLKIFSFLFFFNLNVFEFKTFLFALSSTVFLLIIIIIIIVLWAGAVFVFIFIIIIIIIIVAALLLLYYYWLFELNLFSWKTSEKLSGNAKQKTMYLFHFTYCLVVEIVAESNIVFFRPFCLLSFKLYLFIYLFQSNLIFLIPIFCVIVFQLNLLSFFFFFFLALVKIENCSNKIK